MVHPSLMTPADMTRLAALLAESLVDMPALPDRVQSDGLPVMQPCGLRGPHAAADAVAPAGSLGAAARLFPGDGRNDRAQERLGRAICRAMDLVPFSCGLASTSIPKAAVGFGFHDMAAIHRL